jgi:hypothetical protein
MICFYFGLSCFLVCGASIFILFLLSRNLCSFLFMPRALDGGGEILIFSPFLSPGFSQSAKSESVDSHRLTVVRRHTTS